MDAIKFHDKSLSDAVQTGASEIQSFQKTLDEATADIRSLEKWLQSTGFCIELYIPVQDCSFQRIGWDKLGDSWRLSVSISDYDGPNYIALVESNARTRLEARSYLPDIVKQITGLLTSIDNHS